MGCRYRVDLGQDVGSGDRYPHRAFRDSHWESSRLITFRPQFTLTYWSHESPKEAEILGKTLTFLSPHRHKSKEFQLGAWDGYWRLMWDDSFLTGLLPHVISELQKRSQSFVVVSSDGVVQGADLRRLADGDLSVLWPHRIEGDDYLGKFKLRDYQTATVEKAVRAMRGVIEMATGAGKTIVAAGIMRKIGLPALYIVGSTKIAAQAFETFRDAEFKVGQLGGGRKRPYGEVVVSTIQSLVRLIKKGKAIELLNRPVIFWDEVHHLSAETWTLSGRLSQAQYRFGMSGTPFRGDGFEFYEDIILRGIAGDRIVYIPSYFLRKRGYLADPYVAMVTIKSNPHARQFVWSNDWHRIYSFGIVRNDARNEAAMQIAQQLYEQGHKVLVIVQRIEHGDALMQQLHGRGVTVEFLKGGDAIRYMNVESVSERFEEWDMTRSILEQEDRWVRIASPVLDEGVDLPTITAIVILAGGRSPIKTIQRIGRGLRRKEGENVVVVVDFRDAFHRVLKKHSAERCRWYERQRFNVSEGLTEVNRLLERPLNIDSVAV